MPPPISVRRFRLTRLVDRASLLLASCLIVWRYLQLHGSMASQVALPLAFFRQQPDALPPPQYSWWSWWDQRYYLEAALAWSSGVLNPVYHWYLPGYPMLGALFVRLMPAQPFMLPDLFCFLASLWLFAGLSARLLRGMRFARAAGAAVFVATMALPDRALWSWVVPWTTTPETPCIFACLLAAARFVERPTVRDGFFAALAGVTIAAFRPADAAVVVAVSACVMAGALVRPWPGRRAALRIVAAAAAGAALPLGVFGGAYLALYGIAASPYVNLSNAIGFEWRLLPLRWVTLMIDPVPLFPDGRGVAAVFPWVLPGIAGMAVACAVPRAVPRSLHGLVAGAALLDCIVFLIYRDLHPTGLWRLGNFHYFKWMLPVFGLYALIWLRACVQGPRVTALAAGVCVTLALVMWRVQLTAATALPRPTTAQVLDLPAGLSHIDDAVLDAGSHDLARLYQSGSKLRSGDATYDSFADFKIFSWSNVFMVVPLRPLPGVPSTLQLAGTAMADSVLAPVLAHQTLVWGLPCWIMPTRRVCRRQMLVAPPALASGETVSFAASGSSDRYLAGGWSGGEATGRWTDGHDASLLFAVPGEPSGASPAIAITASGYVPQGSEPVAVQVSANGEPVATWSMGPAPATVSVAIPHDLVDPDGGLRLDLHIANPRRPADYGLGDPRELGIFVAVMGRIAPVQ